MEKLAIGLTFDHESGGLKEGSYSKMPFYAIRENYCTSISARGAIPLPLVHEPELVDDFLNRINGLVIIGGAFDIHPSLYGSAHMHETVTLKEKRTTFEFAITKGALARKMPVLGICGGQQLLNVVLGGTLIQHIPDSIANALAHEQPNPRTEPGHKVDIVENTLLSRIIGKKHMAVNSAHHQAVERCASPVLVNAWAEDGVIEGIELPESVHPFCLGVQWHPEYHVDDKDGAIFDAFLAAAAVYAKENAHVA